MNANLDAMAGASFKTAPFPHFSGQSFLGQQGSTELLEWLEQGAPWRLNMASFYEQYEFSVVDAELPDSIAPLFDPKMTEMLKDCVSHTFGAKLAAHHDITVHKLVPGQRIRIHNDFIPGRESHRVLVQLNRGWKDSQGGALLMFGSDDPRDVRKAFRPLHDSCVAFEISQNSHHAVTPIVEGERFTLVYSFYRAQS